jgi:endonuclease YncB( thermonuclease family)
MKKLLLLILLSTSVSAEIYDYPITKVVDGDTVDIKATFLPKPLKPVLSVRILGVDTPEHDSRAKCPEEKVLGDAATVFTKKLVTDSKKQQVVIVKWDKYGGRVLGDILLDNKKLSEELIKQGYAKPYFGGKKESWCPQGK